MYVILKKIQEIFQLSEEYVNILIIKNVHQKDINQNWSCQMTTTSVSSENRGVQKKARWNTTWQKLQQMTLNVDVITLEVMLLLKSLETCVTASHQKKIVAVI